MVRDYAFSDDDHRFMARALSLAKRGEFSTQPNPKVGCVIVKDGVIVGEGYHQKAGQGHAEVNALNAAGSEARGATVYVTLEPCSHTGRTPPCTGQLLEAGVGRVFYAADDINPRVAGSGAAKLSAAGIDVQGGLMAAEARKLNRGFFHRHESGRPYVTVKLAMTIDGKIGLKTGESKWITGPEARADVQRLRARSCAVVTGSGTVVADNPQLVVRDPTLQMRGRQPRVVVLDSKLSLNPEYEIFHTDAACTVVYVHSDPAKTKLFEDAGVSLHHVDGTDAGVSLSATLDWLAELECNEILVEAGPQVASAFISESLWDEIALYVAPKLIGLGGQDGFCLPTISGLSKATAVNFADITYVGNDLRIKLTPT
ncbi:MAG: bifunctional diaminohydroxyphosphoribosylaminopyrimidine deaminase/5-amino-6-(5-phosphoribosylamino)uracil reductase RibD [Gammaproteobacteria bacterium]